MRTRGSPPSGAATGAGTAADEDFLSALGSALAADLAARGVVRRFPRGHALFHEGQVADRVLVLRRGRVKVVALASNHREVVLAFLGPGELVGDQGALDGAPRSATAVAVEPVEALALSLDAFRAFLAAHPHVALLLLEMLSRRLRDADAKRVEFSAGTTIERVAARLLELAERFGHDEPGGIRIELPLSQQDLAGATGASIESVTRALGTMRSLKCIETRRREIRILDAEALSALRQAAR